MTITRIEFSHCVTPKDVLAIGLSSGQIMVVETRVRDIDETKNRSYKLLATIKEHKNAITSLIWDEQDPKILYAGDSAGLVTRSSPLARLTNVEVLYTFEAAVVQLQVQAHTLLASCQTRCVTLDLSAKPRQVLPVGSKARDGQFGVCFGLTDSKQLYSARPGILFIKIYP